MKSITLQEANARADQWKAQRDEQDQAPTADYYRDASAHDLISMRETGKGTDGKKLTPRERACLIEAWVETFGRLPPCNDDAVANPVALTKRIKPEPLPADDTMLRMTDVERLTGLTKSTIKRMVADGRFPKPMRLGLRAIGWPASDVRAFVETLNEQRRRTRQ